MARRPSTVRSGQHTTHEGTMPTPQKILMVSEVDIMDVISSLNELDITIAANYGEAIEKIHESVENNDMFDHVITDAVLPNEKSGLDILHLAKEFMPEAKVVVCHNEESCSINNRTWFIASCLKAHFPNAEFMQKSIPRHLSELLPQRQCA